LKATGIPQSVRTQEVLLRIESKIDNSTNVSAHSNEFEEKVIETIKSGIEELRNNVMSQPVLSSNTETVTDETIAEETITKFPTGSIQTIWYHWFAGNKYEQFSKDYNYSKAKRCINFMVSLLEEDGKQAPTMNSTCIESMEILRKAKELLKNKIKFKKGNDGGNMSYTSLYNLIKKKPDEAL
jgi:hypothetical protein